jgi:UDP-N-acetyl-2-amino-2-deoxyglucuronate dehydrogenase
VRAYATIRDRRIRFGVVGCGRISKYNLEALRLLAADAEIVGVCDADDAAREAAAKATGARPHVKYEEMLARPELDAVVIATPSGLHAGQAVLAARAGKHVVTEKPMATRLEDGERMIAACDTAGVRLFVIQQNRRNATLQLLKRALEQGRFGRIYMVTLNVFWTRPQDYYDAAKWRGTWELDGGGAFINQASHYVDLLHWLFGPVESVQAYTATLARDIETEDTGVLAVRWRSGAVGSMNVTMLTYPKNLEGSIAVIGEKGTVRIGGLAVNRIEHWEFADKRPEDSEIEAASESTTAAYGVGHPHYYKNVIATLRGEAEPETDGREGLKLLELLVATYRAAREGRRVTLPLDQ